MSIGTVQSGYNAIMSVGTVQSAYNASQLDEVDVTNRESLTTAYNKMGQEINGIQMNLDQKMRTANALYQFTLIFMVGSASLTAINPTLGKVCVLAGLMIGTYAVTKEFALKQEIKRNNFCRSQVQKMETRLSSEPQLNEFSSYVMSKNRTTKINLDTFTRNFLSFDKEHAFNYGT
jgi:hypothetical protein